VKDSRVSIVDPRWVLLAWLVSALPTALGDEFDRLEGPALVGVPASKEAKARERLTIAEIGTLPNVLRGVRSAPIVVTTDEGNVARILAVPALRKPTKEGASPVPILVLERFETFETPKGTTRLARARGVILFDSFQYDLDAGQVVPEGQGGDIAFRATGAGGPSLVAVGKAQLYTLARSPLGPESASGQPSPGKLVRPGDFAGRYRLFADGQWSGPLELKVEDQGAVSGTFRSDETGTSYRVTGQIAADSPRTIHFAVAFPRSRLEFTGHLWAEGKGAMAGTATLLGRDSGFFALRDGAHYAAEGAELADANPRPVTLQADGRFLLDGKALDADGLAGVLRDEKPVAIVLRVSGTLPYAAVARGLETIRTAGVADLRVAIERGNDRH
jgi:hypothetical protein